MATLAALLGLDLLEELPELATALNPPEWYTQAACRGMGPAMFFLDKGQQAGPAKAVCARCPVTVQCHAQAIENDETGIWAGTSPAERRRASAA